MGIERTPFCFQVRKRECNQWWREGWRKSWKKHEGNPLENIILITVIYYHYYV